MKTPHDQSEYQKVDAPIEQTEAADQPEQTEQEYAEAPAKQKKSKLSGAYYYVETDEKKLSELTFIRNLLSIIALLLQTVVLCLPQGSLEYVTNTYPSVSFCYMVAVLVMIGVAIWLIILNMTRYKNLKRIPVEHAPKNGFSRRAFFANELYIATNALIAVFEIMFICFSFDAIGLVGMFISVLALAAAIAARQVTHYALKNATIVPAPDKQPEE